MKFPSTLMYDEAQLEELILARINQVFALTDQHLTQEDATEEKTGTELPKNFLTTYDMYDDEPPIYNINSFH